MIVWKEHYCGIVQNLTGLPVYVISYSREYLHAWQNNDTPKIKDDDLVSSFLGSDGWGDMGWLIWRSEEGDFVHVFYEVLKLSSQLTSDIVEKPAYEKLALKVIQEMQNSLVRFLERVWTQLDDFDYEPDKKITKLLAEEVNWYKSNLVEQIKKASGN